MSLALPKPAADAPDEAWAAWRALWEIRADTTYVNHGSFGPPPRPVVEAQDGWRRALNEQPMDFFVRQLEPAWLAARERLARFVETAAENLVFVDNATAGMNVVAHSLTLPPNAEVLLNDHEYGAVRRIWERACGKVDGAKVVDAKLPEEIESTEQVVQAIFARVTPNTRLIVVSHITSPTAITMPVREICARAREGGIPVAIDGPHAPAQVDLDIGAMACDFYVASLHKWLSAPLGSGFLYVAPRWHEVVSPPQLSWGRLAPAKVDAWWHEFIWTGTRDYSPYLATTAAIALLEQLGPELFRERTHHLAEYARGQLVDVVGGRPRTPNGPEWYGAMASVRLPDGDCGTLQRALWERHGIEIPVVEVGGIRSTRISCHLYNTKAEIDRTVAALADELRAGH